MHVMRRVPINIQTAIHIIATNESHHDTGRARVEQDLAWSHQERSYLGASQRLTAGARTLPRNGG